MPSENKIRIFIVDDHPIVYDGLKMLLEREDDLEVCGIAESATGISAIIEKTGPDILIVDVSLKGSINGIDLVKAIKKRFPHIKILVLSMYDEEVYAERAVRAGARGYIMKQEMTNEIIVGIRHILEGKIFLSKKMTSRFIDELIFDQDKALKNPVDKLTDRELEVFQLIGEGYSTSDIAKKLNLSAKTIDTYKLRIKTKLNLKNSSELVKFSIKWIHSN